MKWVKVLIISSLAVLQFSACSLDNEDEGFSVTRMQNVRGTPVPTDQISDLLNSTGDWGVFHNSQLVSNPNEYRNRILGMLYTGGGQMLLGNINPSPLGDNNDSGVFFKGRLRSNSGSSLTSNPQAYLESLKSDVSQMQFLVQVWDDMVGSYQNGQQIVDPYTLYFGRTQSSGFSGSMGFDYRDNGNNNYTFSLAAQDQYGTIYLQGYTGTSNDSYSEGQVTYVSANGQNIDIGRFKVPRCKFFIC